SGAPPRGRASRLLRFPRRELLHALDGELLWKGAPARTAGRGGERSRLGSLSRGVGARARGLRPLSPAALRRGERDRRRGGPLSPGVHPGKPRGCRSGTRARRGREGIFPLVASRQLRMERRLPRAIRSVRGRLQEGGSSTHPATQLEGPRGGNPAPPRNPLAPTARRT